MKPYDEKTYLEAGAYFLMAAVAFTVSYLLCYLYPVAYVRLVTEDQWGEYGTALGFFLAGLLLLVLVLKSGPFSRKLLWALVGIGAIFIAGEEISWGQRFFRKIFHISIVPDLFMEINAQRELNFHNIEFLDPLNRDGRLHQAAGYLVLVWSLLSATISISPSLRDKIENAGLPLIHLRLLPLFLLVPYFFLLDPLPKWSEIGELFLGIAVAMWAVDLFFRYGMDATPRGGRAVSIMTVVLFSCAVLAAVLTWIFPGKLDSRLNKSAFRDFPKYGMYVQAEQLIDHIYRHPIYLEQETRLNHARMLNVIGQEEKAKTILKEALKETGNSPTSGEATGGFYRRRGIIHSLLGDNASANEDFSKAILADQKQIQLTADPDEKAEYLWSIARTLEARGDFNRALVQAQNAKETAVSAALAGELDRWVNILTSKLPPYLP